MRPSPMPPFHLRARRSSISCGIGSRARPRATETPARPVSGFLPPATALADHSGSKVTHDPEADPVVHVVVDLVQQGGVGGNLRILGFTAVVQEESDRAAEALRDAEA